MILQYNREPGAKAIVIYHANCMDGFAAAWAFYRLAEWRYSGGVTYHACNYGDPEPEFRGDNSIDVFVVDFSFSREVLKRLSNVARTVTVLDHHKTAAEDLTGWEDQPSNLAIIFDMNRSGAGITWDFCKDWKHLHENSPLDMKNSRAFLVNYVEDRDLWKFKLPNSREINAYIALADHTFEAYDELYTEIGKEYDKVVEIGDALERKHFKIASQIAEHSRHVIYLVGREEISGVEVNCPPQFASDVGNILAQNQLFADCWWVDKDNTTHHSLRSADKYDVSSIAKMFGGGGHKNAAGYKVKAPGND